MIQSRGYTERQDTRCIFIIVEPNYIKAPNSRRAACEIEGKMYVHKKKMSARECNESAIRPVRPYGGAHDAISRRSESRHLGSKGRVRIDPREWKAIATCDTNRQVVYQ